MKGILRGRYAKFRETSTVSPPRPITFSSKSENLAIVQYGKYVSDVSQSFRNEVCISCEIVMCVCYRERETDTLFLFI
jgi:hypothetical protein